MALHGLLQRVRGWASYYSQLDEHETNLGTFPPVRHQSVQDPGLPPQGSHEDAAEPPAVPLQLLGLWRLTAILYMVTVCGAYATEEIVRFGGGPLPGLVMLVVLPWIWGLPTGLGVAELATTLPSNAGVLVWVNTVFDSSVTSIVALWSLLLNQVDNAIYPNLFVDYLTRIIGELPWGAAGAVKAVVVLCCMVLNIVGVDVVGSASIAFMVVCLLPFGALVVACLPRVSPIRWLDCTGKVQWVQLVPLMTWNLSGFDAAGHIAEEVSEPARCFPRAMAACLVLAIATLLLPILAASSIDQNYDSWVDGYWVVVAGNAGGRGLQALMTLGACFSSFGLLVAYLCTTSRALASMAAMGIFTERANHFLGRISPKYGTPITAIVVMSSATLTFAVLLDFNELVGISSLFYANRLLLIVLSLLRLRFKYPDLPRPYKLPGGKWALVAMQAFPVMFCLLNVGFTLGSSPLTLALGPGCVVLTSLLGLVYTKFYRPDGYLQLVALPGTAPAAESDHTPKPNSGPEPHRPAALTNVGSARLWQPDVDPHPLQPPDNRTNVTTPSPAFPLGPGVTVEAGASAGELSQCLAKPQDVGGTLERPVGSPDRTVAVPAPKETISSGSGDSCASSSGGGKDGSGDGGPATGTSEGDGATGCS